MTSVSSRITTANSMTTTWMTTTYIDEDNLDEAKVEALFAPTTRRAGGKADFIAFIEVKKLMIKRKWSLRHIILLYTRFGMATRRVRGLSHALIKRLATRFYDTQTLVALLSFLHRRFGASGSDSSITMTSHSQKLGILTLLGCLFEYIHQAVLTSRLDHIQSLACCRSRYTATPHRGGQNTATHMR
ncbi:hypothetical protein V8E54_010051 [Elaphomyces granulatus]